MSRGVLTTADDIAAATYIEHAVAPFGRDEPGAVSGPDHLRTVATWLRDQFPDMRMTIELFGFGATPAVTAPQQSEVFDATQTALGGLQSGGG